MAPIVTMVGPKTPHGKECIPADISQNIKVFVRCRPLKDNEKKNVIDVFSDRKEVRINESKNSNERYNSKTFTFDNAFASDTTQLQIYRSVVEPLIEQVVMGYNCTVFAYGQTGTGKTYTMEGERSVGDSVCSWEDDPTAGIIPRALHQLFETLLAENTEHTVRVSFLELYNEELYDLLSPIDDTTKLKIFEDSARKGSVIVGGLEEITVHSKAEIYEILKKGSAKRQTAATLLNACSSRSHTIFSVTVHIKESAIDGEDLVKIGKLNLVDLAGSENIGRSGAIEKRAREAGNINQSLLTLGRVITSLVDRTPHIPYRESKLTRLLQESLGGRTKTSIIATISPNIADADDTLSTLEYAQRAKKITNKPEINQKMSKKTLLREYTAEIERLRRDLAACREKNGIYVDQDNFNQMEQQIKDQIQVIEEKTSQIQALTDEMLRIQCLFDETKEELELTNKDLVKTCHKLTETSKNLIETRTDRDEQKHLLEIHVNTENKLSIQAKQLLSVAEVTTSDVHKLHQKVNRQKSVEKNNLSKTDEFQTKFLENMGHLQELVTISTTSCNDSLEEMQDSIKGSVKSIEDVVTDTRNTLQTFNDTISSIKSQLSSTFTKDRIVLEQSLMLKDSTTKVDTNLVQLFEDMTSSVNDTQKAIYANIEKLNQTVAQQRQDVEDVVIKQNSHNERVAKMFNNSFDSIRKELKTIFETQNEEMSSMSDRIQSLNNINTDSLQEFRIDMGIIASELQKMEKHVTEKMSASENGYKQMLNTIEENIISRNNTLKEFDSKVESLAVEIRSEQKVGLKHIERIDELNSETTQDLMNELNQINSNNTKFSNNTKELIDSRKQLLSQQIDENKSLIEDSIKFGDKQMTAKQTTLKSFEKCLSEGFEKQMAFVTQIGENIDQIKDCVADKTSEVIRMSQTMEKSQIREIENRSKSFENFVKNDLIKDIPTGSTPQKTTYSFPRDLVETSPHHKILERFRLINACNTPLPESEEKDNSEDLSSSGSTASLHSFSSNDENMKPLTDTEKTRKKSVLSSNAKSKASPDSDQNSGQKSGLKRTATPRTLATKQNN